jgi:hypothetical protein
MKRIHIFLAVLVVSLLYSCNGMVTFYLNQSSNTTIKSTVPGVNVPFNIPVGSVSTSSSQEFENNNTTPDMIKEVSLQKLTITITNPADEDFSFLKSMEIYIEKSDGSDKQLLASIDDVNSSAQTIELTPSKDVNLVPYLKEDSYKLDTKVTIREAPGHDIDIRIDLRFKISAKIL